MPNFKRRYLAAALSGIMLLSPFISACRREEIGGSLPSVPFPVGDTRLSAITESADDGLLFGAPLVERSDFVLTELPGEDAVFRSTDPMAGEGTVIAIIDTGFDVSHPAFALPEGAVETIGAEGFADFVWETNAAGLLYKETGESDGASAMYCSRKIPFMFDYAERDTDVGSGKRDHGTHVAALAAGGGVTDETLPGAAPAAQLLLMKVFGDDGKSCRESDLVMAVEDAVRLGADVINLSLGAPAAAASDASMVRLALSIREAERAGVLVVCAAGNDGVSGAEGVHSDSMRADNPDTGLPNEPAILPETLAVGAAQNAVYYARFLTVDDRRILYREASEAGDTAPSFFETLGGGKYEFSAVPGVGTAEDFESVNVEGKIAVVLRGEISFAEKTENAALSGAVGIVICNNESGTDILMTVGEAAIPAVSVSFEDGAYLIKKSEGTLTAPDAAEFERVEERAVSAFSSWGPSADLALLPDLVAVGSDVASAIPGGYEVMSGTSMAAPQITGIAAAYIAENGDLLSRMEKADIADHVRAVLTSCAVPLTDGAGVPLSPRAQGAGNLDCRADVSAMTLTLTDRGGGGYVSLGEELFTEADAVSFDAAVTNFGTEPVTLTFKAEVITEDSFEKDGVRYTTYTPVRVPCTVDVSEGTLTLAPGETKTVSVSIAPDRAFLEAHASIFKNGFFLEGYLTATLPDGTHGASVPYFGFVGDWEAAPMLDTGDFDGGESYYGGQHLYLSGPFSKERIVSEDSEYFAFSPNGGGVSDSISYRLFPLRDIDRCQVTVRDASGEILYESAGTDVPKSYVTDGGLTYFVLRLWDGTDGWNDRCFFPDGDYTARITAYSHTDAVQTVEIPLSIDTEAPTLSVKHAGGKITAEATDGHMLYSFKIYLKNPAYNADDPWSGEEYLVSEEILGPADTLSLTAAFGDAEYLYVRAEDFAGNVTIVRAYADSKTNGEG